jgi:hypothetical protein
VLTICTIICADDDMVYSPNKYRETEGIKGTQKLYINLQDRNILNKKLRNILKTNSPISLFMQKIKQENKLKNGTKVQ